MVKFTVYHLCIATAIATDSRIADGMEGILCTLCSLAVMRDMQIDEMIVI
jgi:hypothetical protein